MRVNSSLSFGVSVDTSSPPSAAVHLLPCPGGCCNRCREHHEPAWYGGHDLPLTSRVCCIFHSVHPGRWTAPPERCTCTQRDTAGLALETAKPLLLLWRNRVTPETLSVM